VEREKILKRKKKKKSEKKKKERVARIQQSAKWIVRKERGGFLKPLTGKGKTEGTSQQIVHQKNRFDKKKKKKKKKKGGFCAYPPGKIKQKTSSYVTREEPSVSKKKKGNIALH